MTCFLIGLEEDEKGMLQILSLIGYDAIFGFVSGKS